uniref:Uncharacterized protein n=1 Tax=Phlebotomus papatasi TaxID=29031 RepID=A0A1B0DP18_PHLPP
MNHVCDFAQGISVAIPDIPLPIFALPAGSLGPVNRTQDRPKAAEVPQYSNSYLPALMQCLQHYTELMQYEPLHPPQRTTTTQRPTTSHTTTQKSTRRTTKWPSWSPQTTTPSEYDLQLLDPLPKALLQDIEQESPDLPALLDEDNVNEFLKMYDDHFARNIATTGRKKVPPTKPYVEMVVLYDLLKREAKTLMLNKFSGYSEEMLRELQMTSQWTGDKQLHFVLSKALERKDVTRSDIMARLKSMIKGMHSPQLYLTAKHAGMGFRSFEHVMQPHDTLELFSLEKL